MALGKQRSLGGIQVLGLALADDASTKSDEATAHIADRKHDALAKTVIAAAIFRLDHKS
ncbi:hypothetical protein D3C72_1526400 [compost metagenome]